MFRVIANIPFDILFLLATLLYSAFFWRGSSSLQTSGSQFADKGLPICELGMVRFGLSQFAVANRLQVREPILFGLQTTSSRIELAPVREPVGFV